MKIRSLFSEMRANPPLKWVVHVSSKAATRSPKTRMKRMIGKRTTGTEPILLSLDLEALGRDPKTRVMTHKDVSDSELTRHRREASSSHVFPSITVFLDFLFLKKQIQLFIFFYFFSVTLNNITH